MTDNSKTPQPELEGLEDVRRVLPIVTHAVPAVADGVEDQKRRWWHWARRELLSLAATGVQFTAHDLTALGVPAPIHPNHWGALFMAAHRAGDIVPVGVAQSTRRSRAGGVCHVWIGGGIR